MSEELSPNPEEFTKKVLEEGSFEEPEIQKHFEAIATDLPLFRAYMAEIDGRLAQARRDFDGAPKGSDLQDKYKADLELLRRERVRVGEEIVELGSELESISNKENDVTDFIHAWRDKLGIIPPASELDDSV